MYTLLLLTLAPGAPDEVELARAAVAVQIARLNRPVPVVDEPTGPAPVGQEWKRYPGQTWKLYPIKAPEVAAPLGASFPALDRSHTCAKCGHEQRAVAEFNRDGTHTHVCTTCGNSWRH